jgi:UDP:flavonoid glycosyltransferase YjiC (YdhE family)
VGPDVLVVATGGAGGDLQPLLAVVDALRADRHPVALVGDAPSVAAAAAMDVPIELLPAELDLGPQLIAAVRESMAASGGDLAAAGLLVRQRLSGWAAEVAQVLRGLIAVREPRLVVTSLFGAEVLSLLAPACPWVVVNSTFYVGPRAPRPLQEDFGVRAIPLIESLAASLDDADLVLHATDPVFDFAPDPLPQRHHYVGPLGVWEPPAPIPAYLTESGPRWALVTISSQLADDIPLARAAIDALADRDLRVLVTVGPDHDQSELGPVPPNVHVENTVPHSAVLERSALLISHAGHGSVMKALWFGRPMVLVPWGRDQPGVAARAHALGAALVVPRDQASSGQVAAAIEAVLTEPAFELAAQQHGRRLRETDPAHVAIGLLDPFLTP